MSRYFRPFDPDQPLMARCSCGRDHTVAEHRRQAEAGSVGTLSAANSAPTTDPNADTALRSASEAYSHDFVEASLMKALFPQERVRRRFLQAVGAGTARAAIASLLPMGALQAMAQERGPLEKKDLKVGFIAITCASPLIMADPLGFYRKEGLNVQLNKTAGWALIRDKMLNKEHDASHFLSPMPLAISLGLGSTQVLSLIHI